MIASICMPVSEFHTLISPPKDPANTTAPSGDQPISLVTPIGELEGVNNSVINIPVVASSILSLDASYKYFSA